LIAHRCEAPVAVVSSFLRGGSEAPARLGTEGSSLLATMPGWLSRMLMPAHRCRQPASGVRQEVYTPVAAGVTGTG